MAFPVLSEVARRSPEVHAQQLDSCESLVTLREPRSTVWYQMPQRNAGGEADVDPETCPPVEYLERFVYPDLMLALHRTLDLRKQLPRRKVVNMVDWLALDLYRHNSRHTERENMPALSIPFVRESLLKRDLPLLPIAAVLTEDEAATLIQARWKGFLVRRQSLFQQFAKWRTDRQLERQAAGVIAGHVAKLLTNRKRADKMQKTVEPQPGRGSEGEEEEEDDDEDEEEEEAEQ